MKYLIIALLLLTGCTINPEKTKGISFPQPKEMVISIHKLEGGNFNTRAYVEITGNVCKVYLRRYPQCLNHEIRHCFEGNWHEGRKTDEDC